LPKEQEQDTNNMAKQKAKEQRPFQGKPRRLAVFLARAASAAGHPSV